MYCSHRLQCSNYWVGHPAATPAPIWANYRCAITSNAAQIGWNETRTLVWCSQVYCKEPIWKWGMVNKLAILNATPFPIERATSGLVDRLTQLICISDIYLLSWRWWPLWSGGLLFRWLLRPKKTSWVRFFRKISVSYTNCPWKSKKQDKKRAKTLQKKVFSSAPLTNFYGQATKVGNFRGLARPAGQRSW